MVEFLNNTDFICNNKADHAFADPKNRVWDELARKMNVEVKLLTTFYDSICM